MGASQYPVDQKGVGVGCYLGRDPGLRRVIYVKYKIKDQDLFDRAFGYIRQYY